VDIPVERIGDVAVVLVPVSELDAAITAEFKRDMAPILEANSKIVLDLTRVTFIDSSGLGSFLSCLRKVNTRSGDVKLCCLSERVRAVVELVRMQKMLDIFATRDDAVHAFTT
jgi:anti-anti-sigma factor